MGILIVRLANFNQMVVVNISDEHVDLYCFRKKLQQAAVIIER